MKAPLRYHGGKQRLARWIAEQLPDTASYAEPWCGMAAVMLARPPAREEVLNDLDGNVYAFWHTIQFDPEWLKERLASTPLWSEDHHRLANEWLADPTIDRRERAYWWMVAIEGGFGGTIGRSFTPRMAVSKPETLHRRSGWIDPTWYANRLRTVWLLNRDAVSLLERLLLFPDRVIYCDPPYRRSSTLSHYQASTDFDRMAEALTDPAAVAQVAVSGYPDDWPELDQAGWNRLPTPKRLRSMGPGASDHITEVLWTNYTAPTPRTQPML